MVLTWRSELIRAYDSAQTAITDLVEARKRLAAARNVCDAVRAMAAVSKATRIYRRCFERLQVQFTQED